MLFLRLKTTYVVFLATFVIFLQAYVGFNLREIMMEIYTTTSA